MKKTYFKVFFGQTSQLTCNSFSHTIKFKTLIVELLWANVTFYDEYIIWNKNLWLFASHLKFETFCFFLSLNFSTNNLSDYWKYNSINYVSFKFMELNIFAACVSTKFIIIYSWLRVSIFMITNSNDSNQLICCITLFETV